MFITKSENGVQGAVLDTGEVSGKNEQKEKEWNTIKRLQNPGSNGAAYGEFSFSYIFGVFLSFFFREGTARRKGWEKADTRDHSILVNFSLGITLLLFTYPQDSRPPRSHVADCSTWFCYTSCFDRFEYWFLISCIFRARLGGHLFK